MSEEFHAVLFPRVQFADPVPEASLPEVVVESDMGTRFFRHDVTLHVPKLLSLLDRPDTEGAISHLGVDVWSRHFAEHHGDEYEVMLEVDGKAYASRLFHKWYGRHQFLIPLRSFYRDTVPVRLHATARKNGAGSDANIVFDLSLLMVSKPRIWREFEERSIWVFSTARSGSTWVAMDIIGGEGRARPIDEPGTGRMFAPLQWDAERFYDTDKRHFYIESGFDYESGRRARRFDAPPPFERSFIRLNQENQILSNHNFEFFHSALRDIALEHVVNEWGILDFDRLVFKMPNDSHGADYVMRAFPRSHMIFLVRDGRDVMRSRFSPFGSRALSDTQDLQLRRYAIAHYAHFWNFQIDIMRAAYEAHDPERRICIRYEDLREEPEQYIGQLFVHLGLPGSARDVSRLAEKTRLENYPESERGPDKPRQTGLIGGHRRTFSDDEIALMNSIMGPNLRRFNYEV